MKTKKRRRRTGNSRKCVVLKVLSPFMPGFRANRLQVTISAFAFPSEISVGFLFLHLTPLPACTLALFCFVIIVKNAFCLI